jgi:hypothetical protein
VGRGYLREEFFYFGFRAEFFFGGFWRERGGAGVLGVGVEEGFGLRGVSWVFQCQLRENVYLVAVEVYV